MGPIEMAILSLFAITFQVVAQFKNQPSVNDAIHLGIYAGGPVYKPAMSAATVAELSSSQFTEIVVWTIHISEKGDLNLNMEFPICSDGLYIGDKTYPRFRGDLQQLRSGGVRRIAMGIGAWQSPAFDNIKALIAKEGTGANSSLRKNFAALRKALPEVEVLDLDDEKTYDASSMSQFSLMVADLGFKVSLCPYTRRSMWQEVASKVNQSKPGTIVAINLQCYDGGAANDPKDWAFPGIPVYPGIWAKTRETPTSTTERFSAWNSTTPLTGGFVWLYDEIKGESAPYAEAIVKALKPSQKKNQTKGPNAADSGKPGGKRS